MTLAAEILAEPWAMEPEKLAAFVRSLASLPKAEIPSGAIAAMHAELAQSPKLLFELQGSTAVIPVSGTLMRRVPNWMRWFGINVTDTTRVGAAVEQASNDPRVRTILLKIDSPGGQAAGVMDAGDAIFAARGKKRIEAVVEGMAASGAFWLASQAHQITAAPDGLVGSIGVYQVVWDSSKAAEQDGVKVHVVRSGEHKGAGVPGAPVTEAQLGMLQVLVDGLASLFTSAVARGRGRNKDQIASIATGAVWLASEARNQGLVDRVESIPQTLSRFIPKETAPMTESNATTPTQTTAPAPIAPTTPVVVVATLAQLKSEFGSKPQFVLEQLEKNATLEQARGAFASLRIKELEDELAAKSKALEEAVATAPLPARPPKPAANTPAVSTGAPPLPRSADPSAAGGRDFMSTARELAKSDGIKLVEAMSRVASSQPELYAAFRSHMVEIAPQVAARKKQLGIR
jgi:signal peptide peptidase SppA